MTDRFSFKQIMILLCAGAIIFLTFIGIIIPPNGSSVTTRICTDAETRCKVYTVEVKNADIGPKALSELAERIITGLNQ